MATAKKGAPGGVAELARLLDQAGVGGRGRRSSLTRWMRAHHDEFVAMLADKEPSWDEVAAALATMGLRDGEDRPPTAERARKAWWSVKQAKAAVAAQRAAKAVAPVLAPGEIAPAVRAVPAALPVEVHVAPPRPTLDLRPAMPLSPAPGGTEVAGASASAAANPAPAGSAAAAGTGAEALQRLREQMGAGKVSLPKVVR